MTTSNVTIIAVSAGELLEAVANSVDGIVAFEAKSFANVVEFSVLYSSFMMIQSK